MRIHEKFAVFVPMKMCPLGIRLAIRKPLDVSNDWKSAGPAGVSRPGRTLGRAEPSAGQSTRPAALAQFVLPHWRWSLSAAVPLLQNSKEYWISDVQVTATEGRGHIRKRDAGVTLRSRFALVHS